MSQSCNYCGKRLSAIRRFRGEQFCAPQHEELYLAQQAHAAVERMREEFSATPLTLDVGPAGYPVSLKPTKQVPVTPSDPALDAPSSSYGSGVREIQNYPVRANEPAEEVASRRITLPAASPAQEQVRYPMAPYAIEPQMTVPKTTPRPGRVFGAVVEFLRTAMLPVLRLIPITFAAPPAETVAIEHEVFEPSTIQEPSTISVADQTASPAIPPVGNLLPWGRTVASTEVAHFIGADSAAVDLTATLDDSASSHKSRVAIPRFEGGEVLQPASRSPLRFEHLLNFDPFTEFAQAPSLNDGAVERRWKAASLLKPDTANGLEASLPRLDHRSGDWRSDWNDAIRATNLLLTPRQPLLTNAHSGRRELVNSLPQSSEIPAAPVSDSLPAVSLPGLEHLVATGKTAELLTTRGPSGIRMVNTPGVPPFSQAQEVTSGGFPEFTSLSFARTAVNLSRTPTIALPPEMLSYAQSAENHPAKNVGHSSPLPEKPAAFPLVERPDAFQRPPQAPVRLSMKQPHTQQWQDRFRLPAGSGPAPSFFAGNANTGSMLETSAITTSIASWRPHLFASSATTSTGLPGLQAFDYERVAASPLAALTSANRILNGEPPVIAVKPATAGLATHSTLRLQANASRPVVDHPALSVIGPVTAMRPVSTSSVAAALTNNSLHTPPLSPALVTRFSGTVDRLKTVSPKQLSGIILEQAQPQQRSTEVGSLTIPALSSAQQKRAAALALTRARFAAPETWIGNDSEVRSAMQGNAAKAIPARIPLTRFTPARPPRSLPFVFQPAQASQERRTTFAGWTGQPMDHAAPPALDNSRALPLPAGSANPLRGHHLGNVALQREGLKPLTTAIGQLPSMLSGTKTSAGAPDKTDLHNSVSQTEVRPHELGTTSVVQEGLPLAAVAAARLQELTMRGSAGEVTPSPFGVSNRPSSTSLTAEHLHSGTGLDHSTTPRRVPANWVSWQAEPEFGPARADLHPLHATLAPQQDTLNTGLLQEAADMRRTHAAATIPNPVDARPMDGLLPTVETPRPASVRFAPAELTVVPALSLQVPNQEVPARFPNCQRHAAHVFRPNPGLEHRSNQPAGSLESVRPRPITRLRYPAIPVAPAHVQKPAAARGDRATAAGLSGLARVMKNTVEPSGWDKAEIDVSPAAMLPRPAGELQRMPSANGLERRPPRPAGLTSPSARFRSRLLQQAGARNSFDPEEGYSSE